MIKPAAVNQAEKKMIFDIMNLDNSSHDEESQKIAARNIFGAWAETNFTSEYLNTIKGEVALASKFDAIFAAFLKMQGE